MRQNRKKKKKSEERWEVGEWRGDIWESFDNKGVHKKKKNYGDRLMIVARLISLEVLSESASLCVPPCTL